MMCPLEPSIICMILTQKDRPSISGIEVNGRPGEGISSLRIRYSPREVFSDTRITCDERFFRGGE
jgi:hypothetical protein